MIRTARCTLIAIALTLGVAINASATRGIGTQFNTAYGTATSVLDSCSTCHTSAPATNPYGSDLVSSDPNILNNSQINFALVEPLDSDRDGFTNLVEINARTFPGNNASVPIVVNNPPVAVIAVLPAQTVAEGVTVTLNGSGSSDPGGAITSYAWTQTAGLPGVTLAGNSTAVSTFIAPVVGPAGASLTFLLTVTDNGGLQATATTTVNVSNVNQPPTANAGVDQTVGVGVPVTLDGSGSTDPDDVIVSYVWAQSGGTPVTLSSNPGQNPTFVSPSVGGSLTFTLTVTDASGLSSAPDSTIVNVTVGNNQPPTADAGNPQSVAEGVIVTLDGSGSQDDGAIASYLWTQVAGTPVVLSDPTAVQPTFTAPGVAATVSLTFQLTVTDGQGLKATAETTVEITGVNDPPVADAGGPSQAVVEGLTVMLDGSGSADPDDGIAGYLWSQSSGPAVTLSDAAAVKPTFVTPVVGAGGARLVFTLTVTDNGGLAATSQVSIQVSDNGIAGFPAGVLTARTFAGEPFAVSENNGGSFTRLEAIDPATIPESPGEPLDMFLGLLDMEIKVASPGETTTVTIYLPAPLPPDHGWFKYTADGQWMDYSAHAVLNATRDQVTLTLTDGGIGDDDGVVNGVIVDPSGPGVAAVSPAAPSAVTTPAGSGGGGGGCFIAAAGCEATKESPVRRGTLFQNLLLRLGLMD